MLNLALASFWISTQFSSEVTLFPTWPFCSDVSSLDAALIILQLWFTVISEMQYLIHYESSQPTGRWFWRGFLCGLTQLQLSARDRRAAYYKQRSESWGFIRRSACRDDSSFHCRTLQHGIMCNNHLGSLPELAKSLDQTIPLPFRRRHSGWPGRAPEPHHWHFWQPPLSKDQGVLVHWWWRGWHTALLSLWYTSLCNIRSLHVTQRQLAPLQESRPFFF